MPKLKDFAKAVTICQTDDDSYVVEVIYHGERRTFTTRSLSQAFTHCAAAFQVQPGQTREEWLAENRVRFAKRKENNEHDTIHPQ